MSRIASCAILGKGHSDDPLPCSQAVLPVFRLELRVQARAARGQGFWIALYGEEFTIKMIFRKFSFQPELAKSARCLPQPASRVQRSRVARGLLVDRSPSSLRRAPHQCS